MQHRFVIPALTCALLASVATSQSIEVRAKGAEAKTAAQDDSPAAKVFAEVQSVFTDALSKVKRPGRDATKEEREAYAMAFEKARAAQVAAAKEALVKHADLLEQAGAARYRAQLQSTAGENEAAMKSYLAHAKATDSGEERNEALLMAANLCKNSSSAAAAKKIFDQVDASQLSANSQRMHKSLAAGLASDIKREELYGNPAPEIAGLHVLGAKVGEEGDSFSLSQFRGKVVLVDFWATWCGPCRVVIPGLVEMQKKYGNDLQVLGVTRFYGYGSDFSDPDSALPHGGKLVRDIDEKTEIEINHAFANRFELNYPIVISDAAAGQNYSVRGIPTIFVIDQQGKVVDSAVGSGEANHAKIVKTVDRLLGRTASEGHGDEASDKQQNKND
ncbi:MAG: TlpA family protein disulfide reductase [Planctomycetes bacterium]|nr:TlpA family protein disulfide reductase [Planctomycetota bacterium]